MFQNKCQYNVFFNRMKVVNFIITKNDLYSNGNIYKSKTLLGKIFLSFNALLYPLIFYKIRTSF